MSNNKQSSLIWFAIESWKLGMQLQNQEISKDKHSVLWVDLLVKTKEIHKEEIIEAYNQGYRDGEHDASNIPLSIGDISEYNNAEQYYNETFNTKEK